MKNTRHDIIVVGTSEGGLEALDALVGQLPTTLAASMFIVQHMALRRHAHESEGLMAASRKAKSTRR